jgi:hypothetical protein
MQIGGMQVIVLCFVVTQVNPGWGCCCPFIPCASSLPVPGSLQPTGTGTVRYGRTEAWFEIFYVPVHRTYRVMFAGISSSGISRAQWSIRSS